MAAGELEVTGPIAVADAVQPLGEQWRRDDGLEASSPAALAHGALVVDDDVADLAGREVVADEQLAADDDAGTDASRRRGRAAGSRSGSPARRTRRAPRRWRRWPRSTARRRRR